MNQMAGHFVCLSGIDFGQRLHIRQCVVKEVRFHLRLQRLQARFGDLPVAVTGIRFPRFLFGDRGGAARTINEIFGDQKHDENRDEHEYQYRAHADACHIACHFGVNRVAQFGR